MALINNSRKRLRNGAPDLDAAWYLDDYKTKDAWTNEHLLIGWDINIETFEDISAYIRGAAAKDDLYQSIKLGTQKATILLDPISVATKAKYPDLRKNVTTNNIPLFY